MPPIKPYSPLRYPGGKSSLSSFLGEISRINNLYGGTYIELYAGGAGAALNLLFEDIFEKIHINDFDFRIYAMWDSILNQPREFLKLLEETPVTIKEWKHQKNLYDNGAKTETLLLGFATFFLNRTNRSGIIYKAGPIGGMEQNGNYLIDVRFNKKDLAKRIERIANIGDRILLTNLDALDIISNLSKFHPNHENSLIYLDPPYYNKGKELYLNNYDHSDHLALSNSVSELDSRYKWLISYDNTLEIRTIYSSFRQSTFNLNYTLQEKKKGSELLIFSPSLEICDNITVNNRTSPLHFIQTQ